MSRLNAQSFYSADSSPNAIASGQLPLTQESRILTALGRSRGPLPRVTQEHLDTYFQYLAKRLDLPFTARYAEEIGPARSLPTLVQIFEVLPPGYQPADSSAIEIDLGLRCRGLSQRGEVVVDLIDLEVERLHVNAQLMEDYWYWFWNWRFDPTI